MRQNLFNRLECLEKLALKLLILTLVILVVSQVIFANDSLRFYLSFAQRMEGVPWPDGQLAKVADPKISSGLVTIVRSGEEPLPEATLSVNGRLVGDLRSKQVTVKVREGDLIRIDARVYRRQSFVVTGSTGVLRPAAGYRVSTDRSAVILERVRLK